MKRPILIATHGGAGADGAVRLGLMLARENGKPVEVVAVARPVPRYPVPGVGDYPEGYALYDMIEREAVRRSVLDQLAKVGYEADDRWSVSVEAGNAAAAIASRAAAVGAELILVGSGPAVPAERWRGGDIALRVVRLTTVPVLAVPADTVALPARALVAIDFSEHSLRAARAALSVMSQPAHIILAHVMWPAAEVGPFPSLAEWRTEYRRRAEACLDELADGLSGGREVDVARVVCEGDPVQELLALASRLNVDLIAAGSHGHGYIGRVLLGTVSRQLLQRARGMVLLVPPKSPQD
ncbi:MAG TPA: universal stress protein [Longimicrobiaceae bacterium]